MINASFGSIVEIILYWMAIVQEKGVLVEGAIIGSFLGSLLLLPGLSMIAGGVGRWKEQRFNVKSAGVSTVLLIMALIGAFTPTLFYSTFGKHELRCDECPQLTSGLGASSEVSVDDVLLRCRGCTYDLPKNPGNDPFYLHRTQPLMYVCAAILPSAYLVGLWFTLRTHVKQIYSHDSKKHDSMLLAASPRPSVPVHIGDQSNSTLHASHVHAKPSPRDTPFDSVGVSPVATPPPAAGSSHGAARGSTHAPHQAAPESARPHDEHEGGGHDAPEWSKWKSSVVLLVSTVLFSLLAELLVDAVDEVIDNGGLDAKFLGLTLFALVPNVTEFMNAMAFAMYGNVALSLEIGSAYAVQVAMIQIPSLVAFSGFLNHYWGVPDTVDKSFTLIFPRWDVYVVFFSVFLLSYTYIEGKSNYFKGSILCFAYLVLVVSFYFAV